MSTDDLALLIDAAREAGELADTLRRRGLEVAYKAADNSPVTNADLAADALLKARLRAARPDYGWLSEETADDPERLTREESIALVILFDQFPRNIFRTSGEAYAYDARARDIARRLIAAGRERFHFIERSFLYLPFEHSEDVADQDYSLFLFAELALAVPESLRDYFRRDLDFVTRHRDIVRKFGRFPHRNAVLGRVSTAEEEAFIKEHGRGY